MAIIPEEKKEMQGGFKKAIDASGAKLMFDALQKYQYSHPIKSTVRELLSNGIDSVAEKNMAKSILLGRKKISDYYVEIEGELYQDSHFNPDYYDLNWLDKKDTVAITYIKAPEMGKDKVVIEDSGVGLGGKRLEKYFDLGYSTKRLYASALGKFGVGAKAAMSIGIDYYTVESRYNGRLYRFNVYSHTVDSIIPQFNLAAGKENGFILFAEGTPDEYKVYYEETQLPNHFTITIEAKKHHEPQYIDAVKSQMLYFDGVTCQIQHEDGRIEPVPYKAEILYEDDYIIMSDNKYFTEPHLLLNRVNYGYIDWSELELEVKHGNIGIKVAPEEVDVKPSREAVMWTDNTKQMVLSRFNQVVETASGMINEELKEGDFLQWLKNCYTISDGRWSRNKSSVLARLAGIVDITKVKPKFSGDSRIEFKYSDPLPGIYKRMVTYAERKNRETGEQKKYIKRDVRDGMEQALEGTVVILREGERVSNRKDKWLLHLHGQFMLMQEPHGTEEQMNLAGVPEDLRAFYTKSETTGVFRQRLWELITTSSLAVYYEDIEVPDTFTGTDEEEEPEVETVEEKKVKEVQLTTAAERRKQQGKTIVHTLEAEYSKGSPFTFSKFEIPINSINDWQGQEVYYGNEADDDQDILDDDGNKTGHKTMGLLKLIGILTRDPSWKLGEHPIRSHAENHTKWHELKWYRLNKDKVPNPYKAFYMQHYFDSPIKVIKVAQSNNILYRDFKRAQEFFITIKGKTITMSNLLIQWNTARIIRDKLADSAFLYNFEQFNAKYSDMYRDLCKYVDKHYREVAEHATGTLANLTQVTYQDLVGHLNNVQRFQEFVTNPSATPESISELAKDLFGNPDLRDGMAVEPEIIRMMEEVHEYSVACGEMLNWIPALTGYNFAEKSRIYNKNRQTFNIDMNLGFEINRYLDSRGLNKVELPDSTQAPTDWGNGTVNLIEEVLNEDLVQPMTLGMSVEQLEKQ